ncbi:hypothetical protein LJC23_04895 [Desulfovibrio sp. OttesenSCG-928-I05]|nr:hypothetical protein [Desulfovibrio sp. OttesenSCG-928-I05]
MKNNNFEEMHSRFVEVIGSGTPKAFAAALEISVQAVHKALRQKRIPSTWVYKIATKYTLFPDWLLTGKEPRSRETPHQVESFEILQGELQKRDARIKALEAQLDTLHDEKDQRIRELERQLATTHDRMNDLYAFINGVMRAQTSTLQESSAISWGQTRPVQDSPAQENQHALPLSGGGAPSSGEETS